MKITPHQLLFTPAIAAILATFAKGQETPAELQPAAVTGDETITNQVSGFKTDTPLIDIPQSVAIFDSARIAEQGITDIRGIIDYTPGVITSQGEGHRDAVVFRGNRSTADFFVDGIRDDVQYYRPLYNVEKVEILRGPNSLTFGRGGAGGILNRVLKKAELDKDFGELNGSINTFGGSYGGFDYNRTVSDNAAVRLNIFSESLENHRDFYEGDRLGINPTATFKLSEDTTLHLAYEYLDLDRFIDRGIPGVTGGGPVSALAGTTFGDSQLNRTTLEAHTFTANLEHKFSDNWKGSLTGFYGNYDKAYLNFYPSAYDPSTNVVTIDGYLDRTDRERFVLAGDLVGEFETGSLKHKLLTGFEYIKTESDQDRLTDSFDNGPTGNEFFANGFSMSNGIATGATVGGTTTFTLDTLNDDTRVSIDVYSIFLQDEIAINDHWDVILGARFDSFDIDVNNVADPTESGSRKDSEVSPRVGLVYKPKENLSFYASYSETFLPRSGEQFTNINAPADALDPDTFENLEAGVNWNIQDRYNLRFAIFQIEKSSAEDIGGGVFDVVDTETFGVELEFKGALTDWWYIAAGYSYLDGEQSNSSNIPREQPENTFSVWNSFKVSEKFGFGLGVIFQDESFADNGNNVTLPSYFRVDASAYYNFSDDLRLQMNIENLLDRDYYPNAHSATNITVGAPINATFSLTKTF